MREVTLIQGVVHESWYLVWGAVLSAAGKKCLISVLIIKCNIIKKESKPQKELEISVIFKTPMKDVFQH